MLDLCAGLQGASSAMKDLGWQVITLDVEPRFNCDITVDVRRWVYSGSQLDLIWASPPCIEFSIQHQLNARSTPDFSILFACIAIIRQARPRYWVIENVRGACKWFKPYLGHHLLRAGPFFLWGWFPDPGHININSWRKKESYSSSQPDLRAKIPYNLSLAIAKSIMNQEQLALQ